MEHRDRLTLMGKSLEKGGLSASAMVSMREVWLGRRHGETRGGRDRDVRRTNERYMDRR